MAVYKKVPGCETVNISTLEFDTKPTPGSFNPVTSDGMAEAVEKNKQDMKDLEEIFFVNLSIANNTLRFEFSKMDYDPTVAGVGSGGTWKKLNAKFNNVWDWTLSDSTIGTQFNGAFQDTENLVSIIAAGTLSWTTIYQTFYNCTSLISVCDLNTTDVTSLNGSFYGCSGLKAIPKINTSKVTIFFTCFSGCTGIKKIDLFDTSKATNVGGMFSGCFNVEEGALALYQQMSTQTTPPSTVSNCFLNCGKDTTTGAAELAQIPASWGGTGT